MKSDPCILYDYIWSKDVLDYYREMFNDWKGKQSNPVHRSGDRELLDITHDCPDPSPMVSKYINFLSDRVAFELSNSLSSGYSTDGRLSLYNIHQRYDWHHDASRKYKHPQNPNWRRVISSITYLNDDFKGGETEFEDQVIIPESGKTLIFPSTFTYPHRGCPIIEGIKKIMVLHIWI